MSLNSARSFWQWFNEARAHLSIRDIEIQAACPRGRIGNAYSNERAPSLLVCESVAKGLGLSKIFVLEKAGIIQLSSSVSEEYEIIDIVRQITPDERQLLLQMMRGLLQKSLLAQGKLRQVQQAQLNEPDTQYKPDDH